MPLDLGPQGNGVHLVDTTTAGGINVRNWLPPRSFDTAVIYCHQLGGTEQVATSYWSYPFIHAAVQEGWAAGASRAHGDNWGNDASQADIVNLYTLLAAFTPAINNVILVGASMGALDAALVHANDLLPAGKVKGIYIVDGVLDLDWAYAQAGFTSSINAAYSVASYAAIPAGHDPIDLSAATLTDVRWRFLASTADTTVAKANNTDPFRTKIAAAPESGLVTHDSSTHTQVAYAADFVAFVKRCIA